MRVPYIVGRWVRDRNHYGRQRLFTYLLNSDDTAVWVVGSRRIGKTSLLRQLEFLTDTAESSQVPLFWDMQGCATSSDLSFELFMAMEDEAERFAAVGVDVAELQGLDALVILRRLARGLAAQGKTLLLLIDEAEVLINIAAGEPGWLARLRKVIQDGHLRTILTSTKLLAQLNEITAGWETSPFLFGFSMVNLWSLDPEAAVALVEQRQAEQPLVVEPALLEDILGQTNRHPYLLQYLCQRLYVELEDGRAGLRPPTDEDLEPDHLLAGLFLIDYQHLTALERRILLLVAEHTVLGETDLLRLLRDQPPDRVRTFLWGLEKLGHVRQVLGQWTVGNEYLRRWLNHEWQALSSIQATPLDEGSFEELLQAGHAQEAQAFASEVAHLEDRYAELMARQHRGERGDDPLANDLNRVQRFLTAAHRDLQRSQAGDPTHSVRRGEADNAAELRPPFRPRLRHDV
jgi:hypothetical protein